MKRYCLRWGVAWVGMALLGLSFACEPAPRRRAAPTDDGEGGERGGGGRAGGGGSQAQSASGGQGGSAGNAGGTGGPWPDAAIDTVSSTSVDAGRDASPDAGTPDVRDGDAPPAPTFTQLYNEYFSKTASKTVIGCKGAGGACHEKDHEGFICSTKANCYRSMRDRVDPEYPEENAIYGILASEIMPAKDNKKLGRADLARVTAWIAGGAKND